jgi:hypothetical protein
MKPICWKLPQASGRRKTAEKRQTKEAGMTRTDDYLSAADRKRETPTYMPLVQGAAQAQRSQSALRFTSGAKK